MINSHYTHKKLKSHVFLYLRLIIYISVSVCRCVYPHVDVYTYIGINVVILNSSKVIQSYINNWRSDILNIIISKQYFIYLFTYALYMTLKPKVFQNHLSGITKTKYYHDSKTLFWYYWNGFHLKKTLRIDSVIIEMDWMSRCIKSNK